MRLKNSLSAKRWSNTQRGWQQSRPETRSRLGQPSSMHVHAAIRSSNMRRVIRMRIPPVSEGIWSAPCARYARHLWFPKAEVSADFPDASCSTPKGLFMFGAVPSRPSSTEETRWLSCSCSTRSQRSAPRTPSSSQTSSHSRLRDSCNGMEELASRCTMYSAGCSDPSSGCSPSVGACGEALASSRKAQETRCVLQRHCNPGNSSDSCRSS
mmetsp:Transcript_82634/g.267479  ORF Transcript_82634/g.267479 Transcript_82634/m.267479 type:complete len:211 (+) Transcript_82634:211-843(+)